MLKLKQSTISAIGPAPLLSVAGAPAGGACGAGATSPVSEGRAAPDSRATMSCRLACICAERAPNPSIAALNACPTPPPSWTVGC